MWTLLYVFVLQATCQITILFVFFCLFFLCWVVNKVSFITNSKKLRDQSFIAWKKTYEFFFFFLQIFFWAACKKTWDIFLTAEYVPIVWWEVQEQINSVVWLKIFVKYLQKWLKLGFALWEVKEKINSIIGLKFWWWA